MKIDIICVGKIKENFYKDAVGEYLKRLSGYANVSIIEVADEPTPESASEKQMTQIKDKEGERILSKLGNSYVVALEIQGKKFHSEGLADKIEKLSINGTSHIAFVIGGSLGLSRAVLDRADLRLSFSDMTFPHQLMRVILLEQIYRSYRIINKEPYHK